MPKEYLLGHGVERMAFTLHICFRKSIERAGSHCRVEQCNGRVDQKLLASLHIRISFIRVLNSITFFCLTAVSHNDNNGKAVFLVFSRLV